MAETIPGGFTYDSEGIPRDAEGTVIDDPLADEADENTDATDAAVELADEAGIDLAEVDGSGEGGRILKSDVEDVLSEG